MSRNGSGTYTLPAGNPVVTGTTITTTWANTTLTDIANTLTASVAADGQTPMTGSLNMANNKVISVTDPTNAQDAATKNYTDTAIAAQATTDAGLYLAKASNLSDVASASTSRTNLGLGTIATQAASAVAVTGGAIDGTTVGSTTRSTVKATTLDLGLSTQSVAIGQGNASIMKNRLINSDMRIDQRNAGASVTPTLDATYTLDRWGTGLSAASKFSVQQNAGSVTPPTGFTNYLGITSLAATSLGATDYYLLYQKVEGYNAADLDFGKSTAKTITISFWVRSSLTGTFGASILNSAANRCYPFNYTISSANTWTQASVTIAGDTTGTWLTTNGTGLQIVFSLGVGSTYSGTANAWTSSSFIFQPTGSTSVVGTNGATWYVTGVQLEVGSSATGFEYRQFQQELALCQRYYEKSYNTDVVPATGLAVGWTGTTSQSYLEMPSGIIFKVTKRASPTVTLYNAVTGASGAIYRISDAASIGASSDYIGMTQAGRIVPASASANSYWLHWVAAIEL